MATNEPTKLKFRVVSREGASRKWTEKWGVALAVNEEFHVTDQLLKLPFAEKKPATICVFSIPDGDVRFRMIDADRSSLVNGVEVREGVVGLGDRIEIAGMVTIEIVTGPAKKLTAADRDGPAVSVAPAVATQLTDSGGQVRDPADGEIPPIALLDDGPTLTLSPIELAQQQRQVDRKARAFSKPVTPFGLPIEAKPEAKVELEDSPHAKRDHGINPDHLGDEKRNAAPEGHQGQFRPTQRMTGQRIPDPAPAKLETASLKLSLDEGDAKVLHDSDLSRPEPLPTENPAAATPVLDDAVIAARVEARMNAKLGRPSAVTESLSVPVAEEPPLPEPSLPEPSLPELEDSVESSLPVAESIAGAPAVPVADSVESTGSIAVPVAEEIDASELSQPIQLEEEAPVRKTAKTRDPDAKPWVPEAIERTGQILKHRFRKFGIAATLLAALGGGAWMLWGEKIQLMIVGGPANEANHIPPATSSIRVEPLDPGVSVGELRQKIDEIKKRQGR